MIELMVSLLILTVIMGFIFREMATVMQRSTAEATKLDLIQESREFMDQMTRDLHQTGYPSPKNFSLGMISGINDPNAAVGLVKVDVGELIFEGAIEGTSTVYSVRYHLDTTGPNCPCLKRSEIAKINGDPLTGQGTPSYEIEVQNVQNGTSTNPIFYAYTTNGTQVTLPVDIDNNPGTIADINTIKAVLTVQAQNADLKTNQKPITSLMTTVKLANCSQAAQGYTMSCQ